MKKYIVSLSTLTAAILMTACGGSEPEKKEMPAEKMEKAPEVCTYAYDNAKTTILWTGFKHTAKVGVKGKLETFEVTAEPNEDPMKVVEGTAFKIATNQINSGDPVRDKKIAEIFFGAMANTEYITGTITSVSETSAKVQLNLNNVEKEIDFGMEMEGEKVVLSGSIDLNDFEAESARLALNEACEAKHTGEDGVSKLWSEVEIKVSTTLTKTCK